MGLTINGTIQENQFNSLRKVSETYSRNTNPQEQKKKVENKAEDLLQNKAVAPHELKSYLSDVEINVLNEVFGTNIKNSSNNLYSTGSDIKFLKGTKLDIRL
jgi:hypothetical protein